MFLGLSLIHILPGWLDAIGQMDALNSLATFAYNHPDYIYPKIVQAERKGKGNLNKEEESNSETEAPINAPSSFRLRAEALGHPLIDVYKRQALLGAPLIRKYFGKLAPISAAGVNSMDVLLPSITQYSGKDVIPIAIFHGILIDMSVPVFVSFFCNL